MCFCVNMYTFDLSNEGFVTKHYHFQFEEREFSFATQSPEPTPMQETHLSMSSACTQLNSRIDHRMRDVPFHLGTYACWQVTLTTLSKSLAIEELPDEFTIGELNNYKYYYDFSLEKSTLNHM